MKIYSEFEEKFGMFGEKLKSDEEKKLEAEKGSSRIYFPGDLPEYKEAEEKYFAEDREIASYREHCKDEAFNMFTKYFYYFWD